MIYEQFFFKRFIIRKKIRNIRNKLDYKKKIYSGIKISENIINNFINNKNNENIAIFISFDGEINTSFLINKLWFLNKNIYVPIINNKYKYIEFAKYEKNSFLCLNAFNILEPVYKKKISYYDLNIIIVPVVAFNNKGYRLGLGGGFYDKLLSNLYNKKDILLIGVAYDFQLVDYFPVFDWDIPIPIIVTPENIFNFSKKKKSYKYIQ
ncbi:5-formyltetrahydrofolate cyclo-ligase [Buchnera aphidicola (Taiwanaphis decaspermi)]|uniref:5-formyltetrahydrofolate cyclo-ligase n=1 Tax=Buchnera aphidicola TaxID=9 RepID=UPI0031B83AFB